MEFWFDDGWEEDYTKTMPFLIKNGCTGIAAICTDLICEPKYMRLSMVRALIGCGWKIASHGTAHKCMLEMSRNETVEVLVKSKVWIKENLGVEPVAFVAPWNVMRHEQVELALEHYPEVRDPKVLHFHSHNFTDVQGTITKILQELPGVRDHIEHDRYLKSRKMIKQRFGVVV